MNAIIILEIKIVRALEEVLKMKYEDFYRKVKTKDEKDFGYYQFDSLSELANITEQHVGKTLFPNDVKTSEFSKESFAGTTNLPEAINLLRYGWDDGTNQLNEKLKVNIQTQNKKSLRSEYNIAGGNACVARYLQGVPQNMINQRLIEKKNKIITLSKCISWKGSVSAKEILEESTKLIQLILNLESQGYRVNCNIIDVTCLESYPIDSVVTKIKIKNSSERLNIHRMSFALIHPSMLRRIIFKLIENDEHIYNKQRYSIGYGMPVYFTNSDILSTVITLKNMVIGDIKEIEKIIITK